MIFQEVRVLSSINFSGAAFHALPKQVKIILELPIDLADLASENISSSYVIVLIDTLTVMHSQFKQFFSMEISLGISPNASSLNLDHPDYSNYMEK
jgi:hypothetical protein